MCIYIGIEDLVANALIELVENTKNVKLCLKNLMSMGH